MERLPFYEKEFLKKEVGSSELTGEPISRTGARMGRAHDRGPRHRRRIHGGGRKDGDSRQSRPPRSAFGWSRTRIPTKFELRSKNWCTRIRPGDPNRSARAERRPAIVVNPDHPAIQVAAEAFSEMLKAPTVFIRSGGSIPIVGDFANHLGIPTVLMGFGLPDDGLHSPNEKYRLSNYYTGIMTIAHFLEKYGESAEPR